MGTSLGQADAGRYTCQVSNKFGHVAHSANVVVSGTESENESSSGGELDDTFRRAARRLHRLFRTKGPDQRDPTPQPQCPLGLPAQWYLAVCRLSGLLGAPQGWIRQALIQL